MRRTEKEEGTIEKESDFLEESGSRTGKERNFCIKKEGTRGAI